MRHTSLLVFSFISISLFGQEINEKNAPLANELSIVVDDIFSKDIYINSGIYLDQIYYDYYSVNVLSATKTGLSYKFHLPNSAIRTKVSFGFKNDNSENKNDSSNSELKYQVTEISLGYEFDKSFAKTQIFYGADLFFNNYTYESKTSRHYNSQPYTSDEKSKISGFGICPLIGVRYFISPSLSISTELKFAIESYRGENRSKYSANDTEYLTKTHGIDTRFGPLGQLSINLHF